MRLFRLKISNKESITSFRCSKSSSAKYLIKKNVILCIVAAALHRTLSAAIVFDARCFITKASCGCCTGHFQLSFLQLLHVLQSYLVVKSLDRQGKKPTVSTVLHTMYRITVTFFFWPIRIVRPIACSSILGFHCGSTMNTRLAAVRSSLYWN